MNKKIGKGLILAVATALLCAFVFPPQHTTVYIAGDSTAAIKEVKAYPETGWGMPFVHFFDSTVTIINKAKNGRSTRTFIAEGLWQSITDNVKADDYVLIQFGHNDEVKTKTDRYTTPEQFKANLIRFVTETRSRKANPVLITPVTRRYFGTDGHIKETHEEYSKLVRDVAAEYKVPLIDLDELSRTFFDKYGPETSKLFFNHTDPGENPNYPDGHKDDTHFNELGARKVAELVLQGIRDLKLPLAEHIVKPKK